MCSKKAAIVYLFAMMFIIIEIIPSVNRNISELGILEFSLNDSHTFDFRELLDNLIAQKQQKPMSADHSQLVELVLQKDTDLKATLKVVKKMFQLGDHRY